MTNARFEDLEKRVKKLKLKRYIKIFFIVILILSIGFIIQNRQYKIGKDEPLQVKKIVKNPLAKKKIVQIKPEKVISKKKIVPIKTEKEITKKKIDTPYDTIKLTPNIHIPMQKSQKQFELQKELVQKEVKKETKVVKKNKIYLYVKEVKNEEALLDRFKTSGDFESAIALAKLYYKEKKYEKSIFWSKRASKLSSKDDSSWIIFAKSKQALGETKEAITALELYLEYFSSKQIEKLLNTYRNQK